MAKGVFGDAFVYNVDTALWIDISNASVDAMNIRTWNKVTAIPGAGSRKVKEVDTHYSSLTVYSVTSSSGIRLTLTAGMRVYKQGSGWTEISSIAANDSIFGTNSTATAIQFKSISNISSRTATISTKELITYDYHNFIASESTSVGGFVVSGSVSYVQQ